MTILRSRWIQLAAMVLATVALSNMQYGWTLFVNPMRAENRWQTAGIQYAFSILIFLNTWLAPAEGWAADRWGPRFVVMLGGIASGASWVLNAHAQSLDELYVAAAIGGLGMGCVFGTCMGTALKLFPERRGFASGMIAAGLGLGSAFTVHPISRMIAASGYRHTFFTFGIIQGGAIFLLGAFLARPAFSSKPSPQTAQSTHREYTPSETIRSKVFWLIYAIYLMIACGGMIVTAQLGPIARDFGVEKLLVVAVSVDNLANGFTRPFSGYLSDRIGRENAMLVMFSAEGIGFMGLAAFGRQPVAFVIFAATIFLFWGEIFSLFPAICGDTFGVRNATANNGLLYTAKGTSALMVPLANYLVTATGGWTSVLVLMAMSSIAAGILARGVLAPMRKRLFGVSLSATTQTSAATAPAPLPRPYQ